MAPGRRHPHASAFISGTQIWTNQRGGSLILVSTELLESKTTPKAVARILQCIIEWPSILESDIGSKKNRYSETYKWHFSFIGTLKSKISVKLDTLVGRDSFLTFKIDNIRFTIEFNFSLLIQYIISKSRLGMFFIYISVHITTFSCR